MSPSTILHQTTKSIFVAYSERELIFEVNLPTNLGELTFKNTSKWVIDHIGVANAPQSIVDFGAFDLIDRSVGVSPYRPQARTTTAVLTQFGNLYTRMYVRTLLSWHASSGLRESDFKMVISKWWVRFQNGGRDFKMVISKWWARPALPTNALQTIGLRVCGR